MSDTARENEESILLTKVSMKLLDYAQVILPKIINGQPIDGITMKHASYITNYLREFLVKDDAPDVKEED